jgi:hypothetical protein
MIDVECDFIAGVVPQSGVVREPEVKIEAAAPELKNRDVDAETPVARRDLDRRIVGRV